MTLATDSSARRTRQVRARDLADLAGAAAYPCISVLLPTQPGPRMAPADLQRLRRLVGEVDDDLRRQGVAGRGRLSSRQEELAGRAASQPTDEGLALFVGSGIERAFRLPLAVTERAVVEPTFATRDLFTVLHRMPPYVLLVLRPTCAHLYQSVDGSLRCVGERDMFRGTRAVRLPRQGDPLADDAASDATAAFLHGVDRLLGDYRTEHPSPLVLAGSPALLDRFAAVSHHLHRLAGRVPPEQESGPDLPQVASRVVLAYLASRRDEALARLRGALAARPDGVARGISACWRAAQRGTPGMLLVEEGFVSPSEGDTASDRQDGPEDLTVPGEVPIVHDLVDDLMEVVILRGGQLALVRDGDLQAHGRVALIGERPQEGRGHRDV